MAAVILLLLLVFAWWTPASAQAPGGFVENQGTAPRARMSTGTINSFIPATRTCFDFPSPYGTKGCRITIASDCGGQDCVHYVGYSYWLRMNNHVNDPVMYIVMHLEPSRGGAGNVLFQLEKTTRTVSRVRNLFPGGDPLQTQSMEYWYFSFTHPYRLYMTQGFQLWTYDVTTQTYGVAVDIKNRAYTLSDGSTLSLGCTTASCPRNLHQFHSNGDDTVHAGALRDAGGNPLGCVVYRATQDQFRFYPAVGTFDECNLDKSGRYTISLENLGTPGDGLGNRIFDNTTGTLIATKSGPSGTLGHLDCGYTYCLGMDNNGSVPPNPNSTTRIDLATPASNTLIHYNFDWPINMLNHPSHTNAVSLQTKSLSDQYFCGSGFADTTAEELMCAKPDGIAPLKQLVVAPIMTSRGSSFGGWWNNQDYGQQPKGHLDVTGRYFLWTTNLGGSRLDAFVVEVPGQVLVPEPPPDPGVKRFAPVFNLRRASWLSAF